MDKFVVVGKGKRAEDVARWLNALANDKNKMTKGNYGAVITGLVSFQVVNAAHSGEGVYTVLGGAEAVYDVFALVEGNLGSNPPESYEVE